MDTRPIGVFDSGLGGLTVLSELHKIMPNENYIYFGDTAHLPYGSKSKSTIIQYSKNIVSYLINQNVKMIVIACGTASSLAFDELKKSFDIPIIDVITPTAEQIKSKNIGIIATNSTIKSNVWKKEILKHNKYANITPIACPLFVPIVEEGLIKTQISHDAIDHYLKPLCSSKVTSLILGCTHYPILIDDIADYLPKSIKLINMNTNCASKTKEYLKKHDLLNEQTEEGSIIAFTSDDVTSFKKNAKRFCNLKIENIKKVNLDL